MSASEQGRLQGAKASLMGMANVLGPRQFMQIFASFIAGDGRQVPGPPHLPAAVLVAVAAPVAERATAARHKVNIW